MKKLLFTVIGFLSIVSLQAQTNVILNKPVIASSSDITVANAAKAIDGSTSTALNVPSSSIVKFFTVHLQGQYDVSSMSLNFSSNYSRKYRISASVDNSTFTELCLANGTSGSQQVTMPASMKGIKYIKLDLNADNGTYAIDLYEFIVNGVPSDIAFDYDAAGNRTARRVITLIQKSAIITDNTNSQAVMQDTVAKEQYFDLIAKRTVCIFPNPTKGILTVKVVNRQPEDRLTLNLFDMGGKQLKVSTFTTDGQIDIADKPNGMYILQIFIGSEKSEWKIIKE